MIINKVIEFLIKKLYRTDVKVEIITEEEKVI